MVNRTHVCALLAATLTVAVAACSPPTDSTPATSTPTSASTPAAAAAPAVTSTAPPEPQPAQPRLAADPGQIAADLVADEHAVRDPAAPDAVVTAAARRQQAAYRAIARHPEWDAVVRPALPPEFLDVYDHNLGAHRHLLALGAADIKDTLPAWRIDPPAPAAELLGHYRDAEAATGVGWNYLAAIHLIETRLGRIVGMSAAGAQGPMQFLPSTFAEYGAGGDIHSLHDSIMAAGRHLAANGFATDPDRAIFRYNNSDDYVQAVQDYAAVLAADPAAFTGYYRWDVYYRTTAGDVLLPVGYVAAETIPVHEYLATHPQ